jgi:hypothetical protein
MIDIYSKFPGPAGLLSNFTEYHFIFDEIECASMEGLLQSFKIADTEQQRTICQLAGKAAKQKGEELLPDGNPTMTLYWKGQKLDRFGENYQNLLDRAYLTVARQSPDFQTTLLETGDEELIHTIGLKDPKLTVLTTDEFCSRLMKLRTIIRRNELINTTSLH